MEAECEAIERAMQLEQDGRDFYLRAAERTKNEKGQAMYRSLADDEVIHYRALERQLGAIQNTGKCVLLPEMGEVSPDWDQPLFPKDRAQFEKVVDPEASDLDALLYGLQIENQSVELYRRLEAESQDATAKQMYRWLVSAERGHFNQLMTNYESIVNTGQWPV